MAQEPSRTILLPFPALDTQVPVRAYGKIACVILGNVARVLRLPLADESIDLAPTIVLNDGELPDDSGFLDWQSPSALPVRLFWKPAPLRVHITIEPSEQWKRRSCRLALTRRIVYLSIISQMLAGKLSMMHGALLQLPGGQGAVMVFGQSGVGKSTLGRRATSQGAQCFADDMSVLTFMDDGRLLAQPAPTWSAAFDRDISVDFSTLIDVRAMLHLSRGHDDEIIPENPINWRLGLMGGIVEFLTYPANWLDTRLYKLVLEKNNGFTQRCLENFKPYCINGDLNGHIMDHLKTFLEE